MSDRIRVMLHSKMQPTINKLKEDTGCNSITHLIHCLLQFLDKHPDQSAEIKEYIRQHDFKRVKDR